MAGKFDGKVVMVTGASGNLGQAAVRAFAAEGAKIVLVGRSEDELNKLIEELGGDSSRYLAGPADVGDPASVDALIQKVVERFGQIDVLAHTVGGFAAGQPVHEAGLDVWDKMMNLNAKTVYVTCGRVARHMVEKGVQGKIVAILSKHAYGGVAKSGAYSASKAAAQRFLESMAAELGSKGINVNGIVPAMIDTPQNRASSPNADYSKWVQPEEIAQAILYLTSDAARSVNGASLNMYGQG
jgi:NAD(P)-dependent dehydrogenase (short-subunit alcohol dehydrogenase family)